MEKMDKTIDLVSPTHGEKYKIKDILLKGIQRASIDWVDYKMVHMHTCGYGSKDYELHIESLEVSESCYSNSVVFRIIGIIPVHTTADGKLSIGYGCGCNSMDDNEESCQKWAEYKEKEMGNLFAWVPSENIDIVTVSMEDIIEEESCRKILLAIIKDMFTRDMLYKEDNTIKKLHNIARNGISIAIDQRRDHYEVDQYYEDIREYDDYVVIVSESIDDGNGSREVDCEQTLQGLIYMGNVSAENCRIRKIYKRK